MSKWNAETAEWYAGNYGEYATNRLGVEALKMNADSTVVDIGCGTGSALRYASEKVTLGTLIGVDPIPRMVEIAREKTARHPAENRIFYHEGSAENVPLDADSADIVFAFDSYDHWANQLLGLKEVGRILKPASHFVVVKDGGLPSGSSDKALFLQTLESAGFKVEAERVISKDEVTFTHWLCVIQ